jgi:hypothetical protein
MSKIVILIILFLIKAQYTESLANETGEEICTPDNMVNLKNYYIDDKTSVIVEIHYKNFESFNLLEINCDLNSLKKLKLLFLSDITFKLSNKKKIMESSIYISQLSVKLIYEDRFFIMIENVNSISLVSNLQLFYLPYLEENVSIRIKFANKISFTLDNDKSQILDEKLCNTELLISNVSLNLFSNLQNVNLNFLNSFTTPLCPIVFANMELNSLEINRLRNDLILKSKLIFMKIKNPNNRTFSLNCSISNFALSDVYKYKLISEEIFNEEMLKNTRLFMVHGTLDYVDETFIKNIPSIRYLMFNLYNMREFLHLSDNKWMSNIYFSSKLRLNSTAGLSNYSEVDFFFFVLLDLERKYEFPNEDFCIFKYFPFGKLIAMYVIKLNSQLSLNDYQTSCTLAFISMANTNQTSFDNQDIRQYFPIYNETIQAECNFSYRLNLCFVKNIRPQFKADTNYYDTRYVFEWIEFIGPIVTFPIVCFSGLILNLLIILIITNKQNKKEKLFEKKQFKYILINSTFNCIECLLSSFNLMSECIQENSIYCSSIRRDNLEFLFYFRIYLVGYLGEIMKTCSILNVIFFSLERYVETIQKKNRFLLRFSNISLKYATISIILISIVTCLSKIFEFDLGENDAVAINDTPNRFYMNEDKEFQIWVVFYFLHYILNDLVFLTINLIIDIKLIKIVKLDLKQKNEIQKKMNENKNKINSKKNEDEKKQAENKTNQMIIYSIVLYIICRLPELISYIIFYFFHIDYFIDSNIIYCDVLSICYLISNLIEYMYILSYLANIFFYYKFNKNFRKGMKMFFNIK